ncbi:hypothetical protein C8Q80DRAFT_77561 [Daedaleopsis nitida]|nr:hypothetical protein C8Q80DRAFT_77561 [Daedaleopsis nitida]
MLCRYSVYYLLYWIGELNIYHFDASLYQRVNACSVVSIPLAHAYIRTHTHPHAKIHPCYITMMAYRCGSASNATHRHALAEIADHGVSRRTGAEGFSTGADHSSLRVESVSGSSMCSSLFFNKQRCVLILSICLQSNSSQWLSPEDAPEPLYRDACLELECSPQPTLKCRYRHLRDDTAQGVILR